MDLQQAADLIEKQLTLPAGTSVKPILIILVGLPGTGKSTLARAIAQALSVAVVESDFVRKTLFAQPSHDFQESRFVHSVAHTVIRRLLKRGISTVSDATNLIEFHREFLYRIADQCQTGLLIVRVMASEEIIRQRLDERQLARDPHDLSDATREVYQRMQKNQGPIGRPHITVYANGDLSQAINKILRAVRQIHA